MKQKPFVTNLRIDPNVYLLVKSMAGEAGVSVNQYLNSLVQESIGEKQLGIKKTAKKKRKEKDFWEMFKIMEKTPCQPMEASEDDKIIYGIE